MENMKLIVDGVEVAILNKGSIRLKRGTIDYKNSTIDLTVNEEVEAVDIYNIVSYKDKLIELSNHSEAHIENFIKALKNRAEYLGVPTFRDVVISYENLHNEHEKANLLYYFTGQLHFGLGKLLMHLVEEAKSEKQ